MFSQYSWGDFIKFILVLAVPYYAYVLIRYYREDIREWISNRGQPKPDLSLQHVDEEEDTAPVFTVTDYSKVTQTNAVSSDRQAPTEPLVASAPQAQSHPDQQVDDPEEIELQGPEVGNQPEAVLGMSVLVPADNLSEQSIDTVIDAAGRLTADEQGRLKPVEPSDVPAARIASVLNNQQGREAFSDFAFNR